MKSVLILGAGNFGSMLARQMCEQGYEIMIVDVRENLINAVMPYVTDAQIGDCTNPNFLRMNRAASLFTAFRNSVCRKRSSLPRSKA